MEEKKLFRIESRTADLLFVVQSLLLLTLFVSSMLMSDYHYAIVIGSLLLGYIGWRWFKGPLLGEPLILTDEERVLFDDRACTGRKVFNIRDRQLDLIGSAGNRKIRLHTKSGADEVVFQALRGERLVRIIEFLRANLTEQIPLLEDDPPTWAAAIRGDY